MRRLGDENGKSNQLTDCFIILLNAFDLNRTINFVEALLNTYDQEKKEEKYYFIFLKTL